MWIHFFDLALLVLAVSVDSFAVSIACGAGNTRIPFGSAAIMAGISGFVLTLALRAGQEMSRLIPERFADEASFVILFLLGAWKFFQIHKEKQERTQEEKEQAEGKTENGGYREKLLTPAEALPLSTALSLDSAAAGIGAGVMPSYLYSAFFAAFAVGLLAVYGGSMLGRMAACRFRLRLDWISGVFLMLLAVGRLLSVP